MKKLVAVLLFVGAAAVVKATILPANGAHSVIGGNINLYDGEYYFGIQDLSYNFTVSSGEGKYDVLYGDLAFNAAIADTTYLDAKSKHMGDYYMTSVSFIENTDLSNIYVLVKDTETDELSAWKIQPIKFNMIIDQCENDIFKFQLKSTKQNEYPGYGSAVEILNADHVACPKQTSLTGPITFSKTACGIQFEHPHLVLYSNNPTYLSIVSSQIYNVTCRQDFTHSDVEHEVSDITVEIDEVQNIFDSAYLIDLELLDPNDDTALTQAFIGEPVKMRVSLNSQFRRDFSIRIDTCSVGSSTIYTDEAGPLTPIFNGFNESPADVFSSVFDLLRPSTNNKAEQLTYRCTVTTCLGDCPPPGGFRKRRSARNWKVERHVQTIPHVVQRARLYVKSKNFYKH